jgi:hypothetical protein
MVGHPEAMRSDFLNSNRNKKKTSGFRPSFQSQGLRARVVMQFAFQQFPSQGVILSAAIFQAGRRIPHAAGKGFGEDPTRDPSPG